MTDTTATHKAFVALKALRGHSIHGLSNGQLSQATGLSPSAITRIMQAAIDEGWVEKRTDGRFAYAVAMLQAASLHAREVATMQHRLNELSARVAIDPR